MDRERIEHQLATDLERLMQRYVGEPASEWLRTAMQDDIEAYLARMFHIIGPLPVQYVSTTTQRDIELGYMTFEFHERATGQRIKTAGKLLHLLGLPMKDYKIGKNSYCGICTHAAANHPTGKNREVFCKGTHTRTECDCVRFRHEVAEGAALSGVVKNARETVKRRRDAQFGERS